MPNETLVFPGHDYKGDTVSTIGEERKSNPRLQVKSIDEYVNLMNNLNLPNPKMMDVAVPANMKIGLAQDAVARNGWAVMAPDALRFVGDPDIVLIDLREKSERDRHGSIPGALNEPYPKLRENLGAGGVLRALASNRQLMFYCAYGERSAMAVQAAQAAGITSARHIQGGIAAWKAAGGTVEQ